MDLTVSCAVTILSYTPASNNSLSDFLFQFNISIVRCKSEVASVFPKIGSKFSGYWSSASKMLSLDFCKLVLRLIPLSRSNAPLFVIEVDVSIMLVVCP